MWLKRLVAFHRTRSLLTGPSVNRRVAGSSPARGATHLRSILSGVWAVNSGRMGNRSSSLLTAQRRPERRSNDESGACPAGGLAIQVPATCCGRAQVGGLHVPPLRDLAEDLLQVERSARSSWRCWAKRSLPRGAAVSARHAPGRREQVPVSPAAPENVHRARRVPCPTPPIGQRARITKNSYA